MRRENMIRWLMLVAPLAIGLERPFTVDSAETSNGIIEYVLEPHPQKIEPNMYNWEVRLNSADSRNGPYEIIQMTKPLQADPLAADSPPKVLVESHMIVPNQDGLIDFKLSVGVKEPIKNMDKPGYIGQPIM